jgi:DNA invertase Pin-like site-specific DNA recombinase
VRAGIYERVSDDQGGRSRSVEQQNRDNQAAADREGWRVVARYQEPDRSASRFARKDRPEWSRLLADVTQGRLDVVVLWEPSRGDRRLTGWSTFLDECRARSMKIHISSHHHTYDLSNPRDWRSLAEEGVDSAWESEKTSLRGRRAAEYAAQRGRPHGRLPYGYARRYHPTTRDLEEQYPDPEQAPVAHEIIERIAAGEAVSRLIRDLAAREIPSPTGQPRWARSTIVRLVLDGVCYIGKRRHNGGPLLDGNWPALVSDDVYWKAVTVLQDPARKTQADGRGGIRPGRARWLLSYIATCGKCGGPLSVTHRARSAGRTAMYRCASSVGGCAYADVEWLDGVVADRLIRYLAEPERWKPEGDMAAREAQALSDEAAAERARLAGFEAAAVAGDLSDASFVRIAAGIEERIAELEARAAAAAVPPVLTELRGDARLWRVDPSRAADRRFDILEWWERMPLAAQRRAVSGLCSVELAPMGSGDVLDEARVSVAWCQR